MFLSIMIADNNIACKQRIVIILSFLVTANSQEQPSKQPSKLFFRPGNNSWLSMNPMQCAHLGSSNYIKSAQKVPPKF